MDGTGKHLLSLAGTLLHLELLLLVAEQTLLNQKKKPTRWLLQIFGVPAWSWECAEARIKSPIHLFGSDWVMGLRGDKSETRPSVAIFLNPSVRAERTPKTSFSSW